MREVWQLYLEKWLSFTVSFKYHIFVISTILLVEGFINGSNFVTIVGILATLKEGVKMLKNYDDNKTNK